MNATPSNNESIVDPIEDEVTEAVTRQEIIEEAQAEAEPKKKMGIGGILKALSKAVNSDTISSTQARRIRNDLGIMQSYFTRGGTNTKTKRTKRIATKKARKINGRAKHKGQSNRKGQR